MARAFHAVLALALGLLVVLPANAVVPPIKQPSWVELNAEQKEVLAPLAGEWDQLDLSRRKKWIGIAARYPSMNAEEQVRVQRRMLDWVKLSPEERRKAREKFKNLQKAPPETKETVKQKWQEYKDLPEEERQRLEAEAAKRASKQARMAPGRPSANTPVQRPAPLPALQPPATPTAVAPAAPPAAVSPAASENQ